MPRVRTRFVCTECGAEATRWQGRCPGCEAWNTLVEEAAPSGRRVARRPREPDGAPVVAMAELEDRDRERWRTGLTEFDFVLGGGIVPGSVVLLGGEPGIGKSTLLLQVAARLAGAGHGVLYVTGEESARQLKLRAGRLNEPTDAVQVMAETSAEAVIDRLERLRPQALVVDSIQTMHTEALDGAPGTVGQVREVAAALQRLAKRLEMATFLVGHVTKQGGIAGPRTMEHIVDVVLYFESSSGLDHRIVRATKNRFGAADEIALFRMGAAGLEPLENASTLFLEGRRSRASGSAVAAVLEGTRPILVEVQALTTPCVYGAPQRVATGFDGRRLAVLLAVLERRAGLGCAGSDVFVNVVGGLRLTEPAADLAVVTAVASALRDRVVDPVAAFAGEVGLGGEVRPVGGLRRRVAEAARVGFERIHVSDSARELQGSDLATVRVPSLRALLDALFG